MFMSKWWIELLSYRLSLRRHAHGPLAKHLMQKAYFSGNTSAHFYFVTWLVEFYMISGQRMRPKFPDLQYEVWLRETIVFWHLDLFNNVLYISVVWWTDSGIFSYSMCYFVVSLSISTTWIHSGPGINPGADQLWIWWTDLMSAVKLDTFVSLNSITTGLKNEKPTLIFCSIS